MRAAVLHAVKDLRIEEVAAPPLGPRDVEVRIEAGGICGSDLHYYYDGGFGTVRLREPMILGHEIAGTVARVGAEGGRITVGQGGPAAGCPAMGFPPPRHSVSLVRRPAWPPSPLAPAHGPCGPLVANEKVTK